MSNIVARALALREGGHTQRMHTVPVHGDASVAKHSWNMATLLRVLHPNPSMKLLWAVLLHDVPERWVGDTPAPAKYSMNPELGRQLKICEREIMERLGLDINLTQEEQDWLRALDVLELLVYCDDQIAMGNRNAKVTRSNCWAFLESDWVPREVTIFLGNYHWERTSDIFGGGVMRSIDREDITDA